MKKIWNSFLAILFIPFLPILDQFDSRGRAVLIISVILFLIAFIAKFFI